jgi:hypothetical protein
MYGYYNIYWDFCLEWLLYFDILKKSYIIIVLEAKSKREENMELVLYGSMSVVVTRIHDIKVLSTKYGFEGFQEDRTCFFVWDEGENAPRCGHYEIGGSGDEQAFWAEAEKLEGVYRVCPKEAEHETERQELAAQLCG